MVQTMEQCFHKRSVEDYWMRSMSLGVMVNVEEEWILTATKREGTPSFLKTNFY